MKSGIERRLAAVEKRSNRLGGFDFEVITCPHTLFIGETPPCVSCPQGRNKVRICTRYVKPDSRLEAPECGQINKGK